MELFTIEFTSDQVILGLIKECHFKINGVNLMKHIINHIRNRLSYSFESVKNRYPCRIIKIENADNLTRNTTVTFRAVTKINIRTINIKELIKDSVLIEKFHPTGVSNWAWLP